MKEFTREVLTTAMLGKSNKESADLLCVTESTIEKYNCKLMSRFCPHGESRSMKLVIVNATEEGWRARLFRKFANHKLLGPHIAKKREKKGRK